MASKASKKEKLTDADRHKRFVEMAKEVGASENSKDFDAAFEATAGKLAKAKPSASKK